MRFRRFCNLAAVLSVLSVIAAAPGQAGDQTLTVRAGAMTAGYDPGKGTFFLQQGERQFVPRGSFGDFLPGGPVQARTRPIDDAVGKGQAIEVVHPSGRTVWLAVYDGLPLACIRTSIRNATGRPMTIAQFTPLAARIDLGAGPKDLRALGYDGLAAADRPKTTYMAISVADPRTGAGAVCGWLTHDRASGIAVSRPEAGGVVLEGRAEYGRLLIPAGATATGETLAIGYFDDLRDGLELYADTIVRLYHIKVKKVPSGYMTWYHAKALDEKRMPVLAAWCEKNLKPYGLEFLQIDDGWQLANRDFTAADPKGAYPGGMQRTAEAVTRHGLMAGIWLTPFGWDYQRPVFAGHRDWFVKRADGSVYAVDWGGDCLDMTNPAARDFLRGVIGRISHDWGYKFFKLDGLWTGMAVRIVYGDPTYRPDDFGDAVFHDPAMTNVEAFRTGLKTAREGAGSDAYFLGCTASQNMRTLAGSIGLVDGIRVGVDSNKTWAGILMNVNVATSVYYLHHRVWHNDPDVLYLDKEFTLDQVRAWASWLAVTGDLYMVSNWLPETPADRLEILKRTIPNHNLKARPVDLYESYPAKVWHLRAGEGEKRRDVVAVFNWGEKPQEIAVSLRRLGLAAGHYSALEYWSGTLKHTDADSLKATVPPRSCKVFAVQRVDHPVVAGTSRHVTQGIIDLVQESWEDKGPGRGTLCGTSRVIGGAPYEIRTTAPPHWRPTVAYLSAADEQAGATIRTIGDQSSPGARIVITSPTGRAVAWSIDYDEPVAAPPATSRR